MLLLEDKIKSVLLELLRISNEDKLSLIQTYIHTLNGHDIGNIQQPVGIPCAGFINHLIMNDIHPVLAMQKGTDVHAMEFAFSIAVNYFKEKYETKKNKKD